MNTLSRSWRCVPGRVEAAVLGSSKSAAAPGAGESAAALCARDSANALGASASTAIGLASAEALHTFTLDSSASRCFFRNCTTVTPLAAPVPVSLADPTGGPPGSGLYTLTTASAHVAESGQVVASSWVSASGQLAASCSCRVLSHQNLLWHHRLGHPSLSRLRSMHSRLLVSGLPRSLPSLPCSPAPPCLPCVEGRQHAAPHSSEFPPTTAPLQTLQMDLNLWPRVSKPETSPTLRWTGKVSNASVFRVWGVLSLVCDAKASKLSSRTLRCVFLAFPIDAPPWQFYHPRLRRVFSSQDVPFDESVCFSRLHPHASHPVPLAPLFLVPVPPPVDPLPPQGEGGDPAADDTAATRRSPRLENPSGFLPWPSSPPPQPAAVDSRAQTAGAEPGGAQTEGEGSGGAATGGADSGGAASPSGGGAVDDPAGGLGAGQPPQPDLLETLSLQAIRAWIFRRGSPGGGGYGPAGARAASPGGTAGAGGTGGTAGGAGGAAGARGTRGAAGAGGAGATSPRSATGAGGARPTSPGRTVGAGGAGGAAAAGGTGAGGTGGAGAAGPGGARTGGAGAAGAGGAVSAEGAGGTGVAGSGGAGVIGAGAAGAAGPGGARTSGTGGAGAGGASSAGGATGAAGTGAAGAAGVGGAGVECTSV
ncbi:unnamed protein product [Closterium sp. NIES-54]